MTWVTRCVDVELLSVLALTCYWFRDAIKVRVSDGPQELDMLGWLGRVTLELIGQGTLGYSFDPLLRDKPDSYAQALKALTYVEVYSLP